MPIARNGMWGGLKLRRYFIWAAAATVIVAALTQAGCNKESDSADKRPSYIATIPPLAAILGEIVGERGDATCLLAPGASPHTYEPKPSDIKAVEKATGFFFAQKDLDGWALSFAQANRIEMFELVPENLRREMVPHGHSHERSHVPDGHFWMSPLTVKAALPALVSELVRLDPSGAAVYEANAESFAAKLDALHDGVSEMLEPLVGEYLLLVHPSFLYFMADYGLELAGVVEPSPGKEPTPKSMLELIAAAKEHSVKAIFTEPQLPEAPVRALAEETGLPIYTLDPLGGVPGRTTYGELMLYNAEAIAKALGD